MELRNLERVLTVLYDIIIGFLVAGQGGELWPRKLCQRMEEETVDCQNCITENHSRY